MNTNVLKEILKEYRMIPQYMDNVTERVVKIHTDKGIYALKKSSIKEVESFVRHHSMLMETGFKSYIPIYPTSDHRLYVKKGEFVYYLMPWVARSTRDEKQHLHLELFQTLGQLHARTKKEWTFKQQEYETIYESTIAKWEKDENFFEQFVEKSEKSWYMSPFELQVIMYYTEIMQAYYFAKEKLKEWYEAIQEQPIARAVLNHGHLSPSHLVKDDQNEHYFINFERSNFSAPVNDLILFFHRKLTSFPIQCDECIQWLEKYEQNFPLTKAERKLFISYFAYPQPIFQLVKQYEEREGKRSERLFCRRLIKRYWFMKNGEYMVMKWLEKNSPPPESETPST